MVELSWLTISAMIIWVVATAWYVIKQQKVIGSQKQENDDLKADHEELREIKDCAIREWKAYMSEALNQNSIISSQKNKIKETEEAAKALDQKNKLLELELAKVKAHHNNLINRLKAKDKENVRLTELIFKLNRRLNKTRSKMRKLYSGSSEEVEGTEVWTMYEEVLELVQNKKGPDAATSEPSTINRGLLRLQA